MVPTAPNLGALRPDQGTTNGRQPSSTPPVGPPKGTVDPAVGRLRHHRGREIGRGTRYPRRIPRDTHQPLCRGLQHDHRLGVVEQPSRFPTSCMLVGIEFGEHPIDSLEQHIGERSGAPPWGRAVGEPLHGEPGVLQVGQRLSQRRLPGGGATLDLGAEQRAERPQCPARSASIRSVAGRDRHLLRDGSSTAGSSRTASATDRKTLRTETVACSSASSAPRRVADVSRWRARAAFSRRLCSASATSPSRSAAVRLSRRPRTASAPPRPRSRR